MSSFFACTLNPAEEPRPQEGCTLRSPVCFEGYPGLVSVNCRPKVQAKQGPRQSAAGRSGFGSGNWKSEADAGLFILSPLTVPVDSAAELCRGVSSGLSRDLSSTVLLVGVVSRLGGLGGVKCQLQASTVNYGLWRLVQATRPKCLQLLKRMRGVEAKQQNISGGMGRGLDINRGPWTV